ncbi:MAG: hypothetical protein CME95_00435 [Hyphomonadaceae bacterium]|nr:hypothetical protein [Hyphomonadaceae bacterium]
MSGFVQLTHATSGDLLFVNSNQIQWVKPNPAGGARLIFVGGDDAFLIVREEYEVVKQRIEIAFA